MERGGDTGPTSSQSEPGPAKQQPPKGLGKFSGWKNRVIVVDTDKRTVKLENKDSILQGARAAQSAIERYISDSADTSRIQDNYIKFPLPLGQTEVTIFVDPETESMPTTEQLTENGRCNVMLMKIYLDRLPLGVPYQVLRLVGMLSTLYVPKPDSWSEAASSQVS